tara:strand:+ start:3814 stop:4980 length:1167 start_codon:yes stop_codon:yes gene_type:complete
MVKDDIGDIITEGFGGEIVPGGSSEEQKSNVVDLSANTENTANVEQTPEPAQQETEPAIEKESSLNNESAQEQGQQPEETVKSEPEAESESESESSEEPTEPVSDEELLEVLNEEFSTEFKTLSDFDEALDNKGVTFASEQLEKMNEFVQKTGRSVSDYIRTQEVDYKEMEDAVLMKEYLKVNNPELNEKEIDLYYNSTYKTNKDKFSEDDVALGKIQLKKDVKAARKEMMDLQESYKMPVPDEETGMTQEEASKLRSDWLTDMDEQVEDLDSVSFAINDTGEQFDFKLTSEHKKQIKSQNSNLDKYFDRYIDAETGNWDYDKLNLDMFIRDNFDEIIRSVANQYRSKGTEQVITEIKNPSYNVEQKRPTVEKKSIMEQIQDKIFGED